MEKKRKLFVIIVLMTVINSCNNGENDQENNSGFKLLVNQIKTSYEKRETNKTKEYLKKYRNQARISNKSKYIGKAYYRTGIYYSKFNENDSAYYYYKKSIPYFKEINDSSRLAKTYLNIAYIEQGFQDYVSSESTVIKALKLLNNKKENKEYISKVYNCLAINARGVKNDDKAIGFYKMALDNTIEKKSISAYKNNLANIYKDQKKYIKSIKVLEGILIDSILDNEVLKRLRILDNLAYTRWLNNSESDVLKDLLQVEEKRIEENDFYGLIASYSHLSDYFNEKNKEESLRYAFKMKKVAAKQKSPYDRIEALDKIILLVKPEEVKQFAVERGKLKDSLVVAKDKKQEKYAHIKYRSEENQKKALRYEISAEKHKSQKQQWIFFGLASIAGFIVYFFYKREKTKKEKVIEVYNTETRLAKKIHDELANDVYLAMSKVQQGNTGDSLLKNLEKIYEQTRNISHENSPVVTGNQFEHFLKQLFQDFTTDTCRVMSKDMASVQSNTLAKEKQIVMYRVLQELLVNMKKYSDASLVVVAFAQEKENIIVTYKDNGVGVNTLKIKNGLQNMETRIKSIGGSITFETKERKGFQAKFQFKK